MKERNMAIAAAVLLALVLAPQASYAAGESTQDCSQLDATLPSSFSAWSQTPTGIAAATSPDKVAATSIMIGKKYFVDLAPASSVTLAVPPGKTVNSDDPHSGMMSVSIPSDGIYEVMVGKRGRIDMVAGGKIVQSSAYDENFPCFTLKKFVDFPMTAGNATLELSGISGKTIEVLIIRKP